MRLFDQNIPLLMLKILMALYLQAKEFLLLLSQNEASREKILFPDQMRPLRLFPSLQQHYMRQHMYSLYIILFLKRLFEEALQDWDVGNANQFSSPYRVFDN